MDLKKMIIAGLVLSFTFFSLREGLTEVAADSDIYIPRPALPSDLKNKQEEISTSESSQEANEPEDETEASVETREEEAKASSSKGLFETDLVVYPLNEFDNQANLEEFKQFVEADQDLNQQFRLTDVSEEGRFLLQAHYQSTAKEEGQPIVLYFPLALTSEEEAEQVLENNLHQFPDLVSRGELVEQDGKYDLGLALRMTVNTNAFEIDQQKQELYYTAPRQSFSYELAVGDKDVYQEAITQRFPDQFKFEKTSQGDKTRVTMTPLSPSERQASPESNVEEKGQAVPSGNWWDQLLAKIDGYMTQIHFKQKLIDLGISEENVSIVTLALSVALVILGVILIAIGRRRR